MSRSRSSDQPGDVPRGRPGWSGGSRKRRTKPSGSATPPPVEPPARRADPPTRRADPPPARSTRQQRPVEPPTRQAHGGYPWQDDPDYDRDHSGYPEPVRRQPPPPPARAPQQPYQPALLPPQPPHPGYQQDYPPPPPRPEEAEPAQLPKKITVTRVAMWRSKQLSQQAFHAFRRGVHADGARESGLSALTYVTMINYAVDAAIAVAMANTLFFAAAKGEGQGKVALYLLITVAPFALVAPVVGPALDRLQRGRRLALAASFAGRLVLAIVMATHFDDWALYPAALGCMVLSKSFGVLKAAVTPRVLPEEITLVKSNSRLTVFGLVASTAFGAVAAGLSYLFDSPGALWFTAVICGFGTWLCVRIPSWVEVTEGEVPASLRQHPHAGKKRQPMGRTLVVTLWGNGTIRVLTGFLMLFSAFVVKAQTEGEPFLQLLMLGMVGAAAGVGSFLGSAVGSRLNFDKPDQIVVASVASVVVASVLAALMSGLTTTVIVALIGSVASALAKVCLDAVLQRDMPEESRASAFGRSETILQLAWTFGGVLGLLLPAEYWIGFAVISVVLALGLAQTVLSRRGSSLVPGIGGDRPLRPPTESGPDDPTRPANQPAAPRTPPRGSRSGWSGGGPPRTKPMTQPMPLDRDDPPQGRWS